MSLSPRSLLFVTIRCLFGRHRWRHSDAAPTLFRFLGVGEDARFCRDCGRVEAHRGGRWVHLFDY